MTCHLEPNLSRIPHLSALVTNNTCFGPAGSVRPLIHRIHSEADSTVLGLGILGDIIGVIWLQVLRNRKRKLVVNMYAERVDKRLEHLKWMPKWMRRFIVWRTSRQLANRDERRNDFLRNRDY
jgi:hypothetical protein